MLRGKLLYVSKQTFSGQGYNVLFRPFYYIGFKVMVLLYIVTSKIEEELEGQKLK